jgi:DNA-binding NarL/FixJ family response regulator
MQQTKILIIDDHELFRAGLRMLLEAGMEDVAVFEASSIEDAVNNTPLAPDFLLLDIQLQGLSGLEGIALVKKKWPQTPVVMLSSQDSPEIMRQAKQKGAVAFASKADSAEIITTIIRHLRNGLQVPFTRDLLGKETQVTQLRITPRQCEVLDLLCQGLSNKMIARRLELSENTVRWHVQALLVLLEVTSRTEAAFSARHKGLVN